jgi:putative FmdB family regulatory protein
VTGEAITADRVASLSRVVPIYEYRCPKGHVFELLQRFDDPPPETCEVCGASPVTKVLYPVAVHFKGSGFYSTDYGRGSRKKESAKEGASSDGGSGDGGSGEKKADDKKAKAAEA